MRQPFVALDARIPQRCVFVSAEGEHGLIHLFCVKHLQSSQELEILHRQASDYLAPNDRQ